MIHSIAPENRLSALKITVVALCLGLLLGVVQLAARPAIPSVSNSVHGFGHPQPDSVERLLAHSEAAIVATIGEAKETKEIGPYNADASLEQLPEMARPKLLVTDLDVLVERVVRGTVSDARHITLRIPGSVDDAGRLDFGLRIGERRLFVISQNPDGQTYGLDFGAWSNFAIDRSRATYGDDARSTIAYAPNATPAELIDLIARAR